MLSREDNLGGYLTTWTDNQGQTGIIARNPFHAQDYFPLWIEGESYAQIGELSTEITHAVDLHAEE